MHSTFSIMFFLLLISSAFSQEKNRPANCVFELKCDENIKGKPFKITKFGIDGLSMKDAQKLRIKLNLFTGDILTADEISLSQRFEKYCAYKKYYMSKIIITIDKDAEQIDDPSCIIQFYYSHQQ